MKRSLIALCTAFLAVSSATAASAQRSCTVQQLTAALEKALVDSLRAALSLKPASSSSFAVGIHAETTRIALDSGCATATTLSWDDGFGGGIVLYKHAGESVTVLGTAAYAGARGVLAAGRGRVLFTYLAGRGSGQLAERTVVLCALAPDNWVPCVDFLTRQEIGASGYPPTDSLAKGMHLTIRSSIKVVGDTLVVTSDVRAKKYGRLPERHRQVMSRIVLP